MLIFFLVSLRGKSLDVVTLRLSLSYCRIRFSIDEQVGEIKGTNRFSIDLLEDSPCS